MKRLYSNASKILLAVGCTIFAFICVLSLVICAFFQSWKLYSNDKEAFSDFAYRYAGTSYATLALSDNQDVFNEDKLDKMNCYYGIIKVTNAENIDLDDESLYLYKNFTTTVPDNAYVGDYSINPDTEFVLSDNFLDIWGGNQIIDVNTTEWKTYDINGIGYDPISQNMYVYSNGEFYKLSESCYDICTVTYADEESKEEAYWNSSANIIYRKIWEANKPDVVDYYTPLEEGDSDETTYTIENEDSEGTEEGTEEETTEEYVVDYLPAERTLPNAPVENTDGLYIEDTQFAPITDSIEDFAINIYVDGYGEEAPMGEYIADFSTIHNTLSEIYYEAYLETASTVEVATLNSETENYVFVCFPKDTFNGVNDFYAQAKWFIGFAKDTKYVFPIVAVISFILSIVCYILYMSAIGHKKDSDEISVNWIGKVWTDVFFWCAIITEYIIFAISYWLVETMRDSNLSLGMSIFIFGIVTAAMMAVGLMWSANLAVNVKLHRFFKHTCAYRLFVWSKGRLAVFHQQSIKIRKNIKWTRRIWFIFIVITIIEYFVIMMSYDTRGIVPFWGLEKIAFTIALYKLLYSYAKIKETATALAAGNLSAKVDLNGMPLFLAEHAIAMNQIGDGINVALEERTKSERMKTELITNVSHDIKTPLTSIINYVDLLNKEKIDNEKAKEYLGVLSRQSARLKKLIEDLIEASKASTGNIKFTMEKINAVVLLNQSIGEFSERLEAGKITVVTDFPAEDIFLMADNRYLWRVFDNLMSNIVKYAQPDTRAYIDLKRVDGKVRFNFRNTSKNELNISADELMERFVRGDKSRFTDGNGLGLSIAKSLTESMGGSLTLEIDGDLFKAIVEFDELKTEE